MIALVRPQCPKPDVLANGNYKHKVNNEALSGSTHQKCMYCESKIGITDYPHVEHIKPKARYPDLEFVWENLGWSCTICNVSKGDKYDEIIPFINPYKEDPEEYITFAGFYALEKNSSERGKVTIREIGLNRPALVEERKECLEKVTLMIQALDFTISENVKKRAIESIRQEAVRHKKYSSAVKCFLIEKNILRTPHAHP